VYCAASASKDSGSSAKTVWYQKTLTAEHTSITAGFGTTGRYLGNLWSETFIAVFDYCGTESLKNQVTGAADLRSITWLSVSFAQCIAA